MAILVQVCFQGGGVEGVPYEEADGGAPPNPRVVAGLPGPEKQKKAKFGHKQYQQRPNFQIRKKAKFLGKFANLYQISFGIS